MFINSTLEISSQYASLKCSTSTEVVGDWKCTLFRFWDICLASRVYSLALCLVSTNPLLNGLIYAGFYRQYRARLIGCCVRAP
jgi:hypothetical protein